MLTMLLLILFLGAIWLECRLLHRRFTELRYYFPVKPPKDDFSELEAASINPADPVVPHRRKSSHVVLDDQGNLTLKS